MPNILKRRLILLLCFAGLSTIFLIIRLNYIHVPEKITLERKSSTFLSFVVINDIQGTTSTTLPLLTSSTTVAVTLKDGEVETTEQISAEELSEIVQTQLASLQNPKNCSVPTLKCGHRDACGLACQMHHRIACLMISYASGMPLIHDESTSWPYSKRWNQTFYPLGSTCTPGPNTRELKAHGGANIKEALKSTGHLFPFPLENGIVVPKSLADKVELIHSEPFYWWIGQFMKYGLRLLPEEMTMVQDAQDSVNFSHPIVGIHVRRTDKISQETHSSHTIEEYFAVAEEYYLNLTEQGIEFDAKRVFLASDDQTLLRESQQRYPPPEWNVIGFNHGLTLTNQYERRGALDQIVQDLYTLADCDYVVCTHSSNVCRVLAGMFNMNHLDGLQRLKSIDGGYIYLLLGHVIPVEIIKI